MPLLGEWFVVRLRYIRYLIPVFAGVVLTFAQLKPGGYDLQIYREIARLGLAGNNPYTHRYADFPPAKVLLFMVVERVGSWKGFLVALVVIYYVILLTFLVRRYNFDETSIWLGILLSLAPGVFLMNWYQVFEDKIVYVILMLAVLLVMPDFQLWRSNPHARVQGWKLGVTGLILGMLQAYGGGGALLLPNSGILALSAVTKAMD